MKILKYLMLISLVMVWACKDVEPTIAPSKEIPEEPDPGPEPEKPYVEQPPDGTEEVKINRDITYQTIESFAASDCWMGNRVGQWSAREEIAEYLFSDEIVNGQPKGIALSGWRFNLGAGTVQLGDESLIMGENIRARTESFMDPKTGEIDWNMAQGQQFFLDKAKQYGNTEQFVLFSNSPPAYLTYNKLGHSTRTSALTRHNANIDASNYGAFADYISDVVNHFRDTKGIVFDYVSPINEPQFYWNSPSQEGSPYTNTQAANLVRAIDASFTEKGVLDTKIMIPEGSSYDYLYGSPSQYTNARNQIYDFFTNTSGSNYVGNLSHMAPLVAGHSYHNHNNWSQMVDARTRLNDAVSAAGLKFYQTEWSMLGDPPDWFGSYSSETPGIRYALCLSWIMHADLYYANAASWSYWTVFCLPRWDHFDRFSLIKVWPGGNLYPVTEEEFAADGDWEVNKNLWVLGNYSRFVRPGYKRIEMEMDNYSDKFFGTAYKSPDNKQIVAVYSNISGETYDVRADFGNEPTSSIKIYTTDNSNDLKETTVADKYAPIEVKPLSVVTVVYNIREKPAE